MPPETLTIVRYHLRRAMLRCAREGDDRMRERIDRIEDETFAELVREVERAASRGASSSPLSR